MSENRSPIPSRLYNAAKGGHVAGTADIIDDDKGKTQDVINQETDNALENRYTKEETYSKTELNNLITTPSQEYVSVTATDQTTSATDVLPATGEADTIYRVGNWDGTQYNDSVFSEYAWNGSAYIKLSTKSQIGEVYDISVNHAGATYADLAAALGTNGANIPQSLRKGGMNIKFVRTSDNNYTQFRCKTQSFSVNPEDWYFEGDETLIDNPEFIEAETDNNSKLLSARRYDGTKIEYNDFEVKGKFSANIPEKVDKEEGKSLIDEDVANSLHYEDVPMIIDTETDSDGKVFSFRDIDGVKHEEVGLETPKVKTDSLELPKDAQAQVEEIINNYVSPKNWYLPKFGKVNIKSEIFFLTADARWSSKNDVVCIQMYDDTDANAYEKKTLSYFYIKSTLNELPGGGYNRTSVNENSVMLDFYHAPEVDYYSDENKYYVKDITKVNGVCYYTDTLAISHVTYRVTDDSVSVNIPNTLEEQETLHKAIEVTRIEDIPPYKAWRVNKKIEHQCIADIDFGTFYSKTNVPVGIKYQGSGSLLYRKRGLRITFYKNNTYAKKNKVKIGEMIRLSGYNMKSYFTDISRIKDPIISNTCIEMWESDNAYPYPWDKTSVPYNGATGLIKSFPIETWFGEEFYGLQMFGLKKDEKNYMLDGDDLSGIFVSGARNSSTFWSDGDHTLWEDEMMDEMSQSTADALDELHRYIKGFIEGTIEIDGVQTTFTREMFAEHVDERSWIDYWILLQIFVLWDNTGHNVILYSGSDKIKFYTFVYDLDNSIDINCPYNKDIIDYIEDLGYNIDMSFWKKFVDEYKDEIINRYSYLRKSVLKINNLKSIYTSYTSKIPARVIQAEQERWESYATPKYFENILDYLESRMNWLDESYFNL